MIANEMARRASRIAESKGTIDDVQELLLHIRESLPKGNVVRDMGDFVAHRATRTQGPAKEITSNMIGALLMAARNELGQLTYDQLINGLTAQRFLIGRTLNQPHRATFESRVKRFIDAIEPLPGDAWQLPQRLSKNAKETLERLLTVEPRCAFTIEEYAKEFLSILAAKGYLQIAVAPDQPALVRLLSLHAIVRLHGVTLANPYGGPITLRASFESPISIGGTCEIVLDRTAVAFGLPLLETKLDPAEICHPPLDTWGSAEWNEPLEIIDGRIGVLGFAPDDPALLRLQKGRPRFTVDRLS